MIVMKFGGVALAEAEDIRTVVSLIEARQEELPFVVVSAMGKTTRFLDSLSDFREKGDGAHAASLLGSVMLKSALKLTDNLFSRPGLRKECQARLLVDLDDLKDFLRKSTELQLPWARDRIVSVGELVSSVIVAYTMLDAGLPMKWLDARNFIITDEVHRSAMPDFSLSAKRAERTYQEAAGDGCIPVTQGFIASTRTGSPTTLGYEGSDLTATFLSRCLRAERVEIWKTVDGIMSADPDDLPDSLPVPYLSYAEASELARLGAKVLHPASIAPAEESLIPVLFKNVYRPTAPGTQIGPEPAPATGAVKVVVGHSSGSLLTFFGLQRDGKGGTGGSVVEALRRRDLRYQLFKASEPGFQLFLVGSELDDSLRLDLEAACPLKSVETASLLALVGEKLGQENPSVASVPALAHRLNMRILLREVRPHSVAFVLTGNRFLTLLRQVHRQAVLEPALEKAYE